MTEEIRVDVGGGRERTVPVELPSNSLGGNVRQPASGDGRKKLDPVVTGTVTQKKKFGRKIRGSILSEGTGSVFEYVFEEVLIPALKTMISDTISQGVERALFGEGKLSSRNDRPGGYISYNRVRRPTSAPQYGTISSRARSQHDFDDIILATRGEAEEVLDRLRDLISQYDVATVADLYDLVGISANFQEDKWGWYDLRSAMVRHVRGGYLISLPRTQPIE
jgi:hypothetical protein